MCWLLPCKQNNAIILVALHMTLAVEQCPTRIKRCFCDLGSAYINIETRSFTVFYVSLIQKRMMIGSHLLPSKKCLSKNYGNKLPTFFRNCIFLANLNIFQKNTYFSKFKIKVSCCFLKCLGSLFCVSLSWVLLFWVSLGWLSWRHPLRQKTFNGKENNFFLFCNFRQLLQVSVWKKNFFRPQRQVRIR